MEFVVVLHLEFLLPHQGMVMVAYLVLLPMAPVALYRGVQEDLPFQDEKDYGEGELQQEVHLVILERQK